MSTEDIDTEHKNANEGEGQRNRDPFLDVGEAMQVINNEKGRSVSSKASSTMRDAYFSFLLLRLLKIRDMRITVSLLVQLQFTCTVQIRCKVRIRLV